MSLNPFADEGWRHRLHALTGLREGEGALVVLMFLHSFFGGVPMNLMYVTGNALFLKNHGAAALPFAYIAAAIVVPVIGWVYVKLDERLPLKALLSASLLFLIGGELALRLMLALLPARLSTVAMPVWTEIEYALSSITFWGLAGQLFNVQQAKRVFGIIGTGGLIGAILTGFLMPVFVKLFGINNVLLVAAASWVTSLAFMLRIGQLQPGAFQRARSGTAERAATETKDKHGNRTYVLLIYALMALSFASYYLVDALFSERAAAQLPDEAKLASFLGVFFGVCGFLCLAFRLWLSGFLLGRYGLFIGLALMPGLTFAASLAGVGIGVTMGTGFGLFLVVALLRAIDRVLRGSIDNTAMLILYQPLPPATRASAQAVSQGIVGPIAGGLTGVVLLVLMTYLHLDASKVIFGVVLVGGAWVWAANRERKLYRGVLEHALAERRIVDADVLLKDAASRRILERGLESPHPGEVLYAVSALEELAPQELEPVLVKLLQHPAPEVRRDALLRIERLAFTRALPAVEQLFVAESAPGVRGAALRVMSSLGDDGRDYALKHLNDPEVAVRDGAVVGLLRSGDVDGIVAAGQRLGDLTRSTKPWERAHAAELLGETALDSFFRPLLSLLHDPEMTVRRAALTACRHVKNPRLWPLLVESLRTPALRSAGVAALTAVGAQAFPLIEQVALAPSSDAEVRIRLARVLGRIRGPRAVGILLRMLERSGEEIRLPVLSALVACHFKAEGVEATQVRALLEQELNNAAWTLAARIDLGAGSDELLARALDGELAGSRERLLMLLALLFEARSVLRARANLQNASSERRAIALELLDNTLSQDVKGMALALLDDLPPEDCLRKLGERGALDRGDASSVIRRVLGTTDLRVGRWTKACAVYRAARMREVEALPLIRPLLESEEAVLRETASWAVAQLASTESPALLGEKMLLTIEKVMVLKSIAMFAETPDDVLAEVASLLKEVRVDAGEVIFQKGDFGDCLYILVDGQVKIHDGATVFKTLSERDVFGEMAVLDPEPRSASVTALQSSLLFRLDQIEFYELMSDRMEMLRGILRLLCQRLRAANQRAAAAPSLPAVARAG